jgi:hypothetical protein
MAVIIAFPQQRPGVPACAMLGPPPPFTHAWLDQHLPLIDAAMDLLRADDAELNRRCRLVADEEGRLFLDDLTAQLDRLGAHLADVADALSLTAERIRTTRALPAS